MNIDYHIAIEDHFYSVPQALVHQKVEARATARSVEILHRGARVAAHARSFIALRVHHVAGTPAGRAPRAPGVVAGAADPLGRAARRGLRRGDPPHLSIRPHPEQGYRACLGLLRLERQHGAVRLEAACARALLLGSATLSNRRLDPEATHREFGGE